VPFGLRRDKGGVAMKIRAWFSQAAAKLVAQKQRIATLALGHTVFYTIEQIFNYGIYIPVIGFMTAYYGDFWGIVYGACLMTMLSFLACFAILKFYDWSKKDWLGIEIAKDVRDFGPEWIKNLQAKSFVGKILWWPFSKIILFVLWSLKKGGAIAFFALSIYTDPFTTTVYFREGSFNGLSRKNWLIFVASVLIGNIYWTFRTYLIILVAKFGFQHWWKLFFAS
jgi:hypothetical protein